MSVRSLAPIGLLASMALGAACARPAGPRPDPGAARAMEAFMEAFNSRDPRAWAATLNYPHVRIAGDEVRVYPTAEAFEAAMDFEAFAARTGWDHSRWDSVRAIQASPDKVHFAVRFTRLDSQGRIIASYDSLYVVTRREGRWGVQARSSFAP